jgi:hypothetical protein
MPLTKPRAAIAAHSSTRPKSRPDKPRSRLSSPAPFSLQRTLSDLMREHWRRQTSDRVSGAAGFCMLYRRSRRFWRFSMIDKISRRRRRASMSNRISTNFYGLNRYGYVSLPQRTGFRAHRRAMSLIFRDGRMQSPHIRQRFSDAIIENLLISTNLR